MHATTQISLEDIMLSEISQIQKDKYCMIRLCEVPKSSQIRRNKVERWLPGTVWREKGGVIV